LIGSRPRIGISRCLLGDEVRYDSGHKRDALLTSTFATFVEWVPVCPELEVGMGVPREPVRLVAGRGGVPAGGHRVLMVGVTSRTDWTQRMADYAAQRVAMLAREDLSGYVLKKDSPSCGLARVPIFAKTPARTGSRARKAGAWIGRGVFAQALLSRLPNLPVVEEDALHHPDTRGNFVERVFAYQRVRALFSGALNTGALVRFHAAHKLQLLSHSRAGHDQLGRLVAGAAQVPRALLASTYEREFMQTLAKPATRGRHVDVLMHALGHLKKLIDAADRDELLSSIDGFRRGLVPLIVPVTLARHHARRHGVEYLRDQTYLNPHTGDLELRIAESAEDRRTRLGEGGGTG
jgi:uncharacterized protein YbgA (DUF1722 family)/uncharacterized protein YbbK (DUF523 family)